MPGYTSATPTWFYLVPDVGSQDSSLLDSAMGQYVVSAYFAVMTLTTVG
jgi:hypothetical protein